MEKFAADFGLFFWWSLNRLYLTIRLWAQDFDDVIVDEAEGRINYRLIEIEKSREIFSGI